VSNVLLDEFAPAPRQEAPRGDGEAYNPRLEQLYHVAGDAPDPLDGQRRGGVASTMQLTKTALGNPFIRYKDVVIEADVYAQPDGKGYLVHLICPKCRHALRVTSEMKAIEFELPSARHPRGVLSIEPMRCPWEQGRGTDETAADRMEFGTGMCNWTAAIDRNVAKDA
jgi:hypothetical protein